MHCSIRIAEAATTLLNCERASIFLHDAKTDELCTKVALMSGEIRVPSHAGIVGAIFQSNHALHVAHPYDDPRFNREPDQRSGFITRNLLGAPMVDLGRNAIGVIQAVNNRTESGFASEHEAMIQLLADQAGVAIQRYRLQSAANEAKVLQRARWICAASAAGADSAERAANRWSDGGRLDEGCQRNWW